MYFIKKILPVILCIKVLNGFYIRNMQEDKKTSESLEESNETLDLSYGNFTSQSDLTNSNEESLQSTPVSKITRSNKTLPLFTETLSYNATKSLPINSTESTLNSTVNSTESVIFTELTPLNSTLPDNFTTEILSPNSTEYFTNISIESTPINSTVFWQFNSTEIIIPLNTTEFSSHLTRSVVNSTLVDFTESQRNSTESTPIYSTVLSNLNITEDLQRSSTTEIIPFNSSEKVVHNSLDTTVLPLSDSTGSLQSNFTTDHYLDSSTENQVHLNYTEPFVYIDSPSNSTLGRLEKLKIATKFLHHLIDTISDMIASLF